MTFADDIEKTAGGEPIEHVIIGGLHNSWCETIDRLRSTAVETSEVYDDPRDLITAEHGGVPLSWEVARPLLDYPYDTGFGGSDCHAIWAYTPTWVLFVSVYDGATDVERVPRNPPEGGIPALVGGQ